MNFKYKIAPHDYLTLVIVVILLFFWIEGVKSKNEIENNGKNIIVKFIRKDDLPKTTTFYFAYYYNNVKCQVTNSGIHHSILNSDKKEKMINNLKLESYYTAKFLPKYPKKIIVNPAKEIMDKKVIEKAGFKN